MPQKKIQIISFFALLLLVLGIVVAMWLPFFQLLCMAVILTILFLPIHRKILEKIEGPNLAAFTSVVLMMIIVIIPLTLLSTVLFKEVTGLYKSFKGGEIVISKQDIIHNLPVSIQPFAEKVGNDINQALSRVTSNTFETVTGILSNVAGFIVAFFLLLFAVFFLLRDGSGMKKIFIDIFPLSDAYENKLFAEVERSINGVVKGSLLLALSQGAVGTIGYFIFGVPQPLLWGVFTVLAALVPTIGTSLAVIPAVVYLFLTGHTGAAIGMAIWGATAVGLIDNIIGPKIIGSTTKLHPVLVLFSILGGVQLFGFLGVLLGPIIMAVLVALVNMYRTELKDYLEQ